MQRNDISIIVTEQKDGWNVYLVQGAHDVTEDVIDREDGLYYSQLAHRVIARDEKGVPEVVTPTQAKKRGMPVILKFGRPRLSVGVHRYGWILDIPEWDEEVAQ